PTYGQASDSMDEVKADESSATPAAEQAESTHHDSADAAADTPVTDQGVPGKTTTFAEPAPLAVKTETAPATDTAESVATTGKTTTFVEPEASEGASKPAATKEDEPGRDAETQTDAATNSEVNSEANVQGDAATSGDAAAASSVP